MESDPVSPCSARRTFLGPHHPLHVRTFCPATEPATEIPLLTMLLLCRPETWHGPTPHALACETSGRRFVVYRFNPFRAVGLLKHINILLIVRASGWDDLVRTGEADDEHLGRALTRPSFS